jgi:hypothetical protein
MGPGAPLLQDLFQGLTGMLNMLTQQLACRCYFVLAAQLEDLVVFFIRALHAVRQIQLQPRIAFPIVVDDCVRHSRRSSWHLAISVWCLILRWAIAPPRFGTEDEQFHGTPPGWFGHGVRNCDEGAGDYAQVARILIAAGATIPAVDLPTGKPEVDAVLREHGLI